MMIITVEADGFSDWPYNYSVEINPIENLPVGDLGKMTACDFNIVH